MRFKILVWAGLAILTAGLVAGALWRQSRPQTFTLRNGTKLTLLAVTYGKIQRFPATKTTNGRRHAFPDSTNDTQVVYIEQHHTNNIWPNYQLWACDEAATACAESAGRNQRQSHIHEQTAYRVLAMVQELDVFISGVSVSLRRWDDLGSSWFQFATRSQTGSQVTAWYD